MLGKCSNQLFSAAHLEILKLESRRDVGAHKCVAFGIAKPRGKPRAGANRSLPAIARSDDDLAMTTVAFDDLYRDRRAAMMVPDLVGFQSMERRIHLVREQVVNGCNGISGAVRCRDSNIASVRFAVESALRMGFKFERSDQALRLCVHFV